MYKKGSAVINLFGYIFAVFFFLLFFGIALLGYSEIDKALDQDIDVGQVNLRDANNDTFGRLTEGLLNQGDTIALSVIFGLILLMMLNAFFFGDSIKLWIPVDMLIMIFVFILSVYLSNTYELLINSTSLLDIYIDRLPKASKVMLNLPMIVSTIGAILMIITYTRVGRDDSERVNVQGF